MTGATRVSATEFDVAEWVAERARQIGRSGPVTLLPDPKAELLFCPIIAVDDHALEPPNLFTDRFPASMRDKVPHVATDDEGVPWWVVDGERIAILLANAASGRPIAEWGLVASRYD